MNSALASPALLATTKARTGPALAAPADSCWVDAISCKRARRRYSSGGLNGRSSASQGPLVRVVIAGSQDRTLEKALSPVNLWPALGVVVHLRGSAGLRRLPPATVLLDRTAELQINPVLAYAAPLAGVIWLAIAIRDFDSQLGNYQSAGHRSSKRLRRRPGSADPFNRETGVWVAALSDGVIANHAVSDAVSHPGRRSDCVSEARVW